MDSQQGKIANTVIVPAYNEEQGLAVVLDKLFQVLDDTYEVIVVDDGSTDPTAEVARRFPCRLVQHEVNKGKGEALKTGFREARSESIIWIDADDTYQDLADKISEGLVDARVPEKTGFLGGYPVDDLFLDLIVGGVPAFEVQLAKGLAARLPDQLGQAVFDQIPLIVAKDDPG